MEKLGEARKLDDGKTDWSILDLKMIEPIIPAMKHGEGKYGFNNWKGGIDNWDRRYYSAMMRHAEASQNDPLSWNNKDECYHLAQVAVNALMRLYLAINLQIPLPEEPPERDATIHSPYYYHIERNK